MSTGIGAAEIQDSSLLLEEERRRYRVEEEEEEGVSGPVDGGWGPREGGFARTHGPVLTCQLTDRRSAEVQATGERPCSPKPRLD